MTLRIVSDLPSRAWRHVDTQHRLAVLAWRVRPCKTPDRLQREREREKKMIFNAPQQYPRNRTSLKKKTLKNKAKTYFQKKMQTPYLI